MASSLDDELARFEAELKALEQQETSSVAPAPEDDAVSKKRARDESGADAEEQPSKKTAASDGTPTAGPPPLPPAKKSELGGGLAKPITTETVVIRSAPKIYMAPPRPAPVKKTYDPSGAATTATSSSTSSSAATTAGSSAQQRSRLPNTVEAVAAHRGALSGFPAGATGEYAARDAAAVTAAAVPASRVPLVPRFDMATGQYLSAEEQHMMNQQQSVYEYDPNRPMTVSSVQGQDSSMGSSGAAAAPGGTGQPGKSGKQKKLLRLAGGEVWEDQTLAEWPDNDFRLFCGDLGNEVSDELLAHSFSRYTSFQRAKVVRDKYTHKSKGYGFVSFADPFDCAKALREMNGKYIGNRPVKLTKSKWQDRNIDVAKKKMKKKNRHLFS